MKETSKQKWVAYKTKVNRTKPGVYKRHVTIGGEQAFVHPEGDAKVADILPAPAVFETKEEAIKYLNGDGLLRWVVVSHGRKNVPEMFQAYITFGYGYRYGRSQHSVTYATRADNGKLVQDLWYASVCKTKKEAESKYRQAWRSTMKECKKELGNWTKLYRDLQSGKPRSGKKGE